MKLAKIFRTFRATEATFPIPNLGFSKKFQNFGFVAPLTFEWLKPQQ